MNSEIVKYTDWLAYYFYQPIAYMVLKIIKNTTITPNQITFFSLILGVCGALFIFYDTKIALVLLNMSFVFDCLDGQMARYKKIFSVFGMFLDNVSDRIVESFYIVSISYYYHTTSYSIVVLALYFLYIYMSDMVIYSNVKYKPMNLNEKLIFSPIYFLNRSFVVVLLSISIFYPLVIILLGILSIFGIIFRIYRELYGRL